MPKKYCPFCDNRIRPVFYSKEHGKTRTRIYKCPVCGVIHYDVKKDESKLLEEWRKKRKERPKVSVEETS